jgi:hypothetical protein
VTLPSLDLSASREWYRAGELELMLVEVSVEEQGYHAVMKIVSGGVLVVKVAER